MTYHYSVDYRAVGPITLEDLRALRSRGTITEETLVLPEGGSQWIPYSVALRAAEQLAPPLPPIPPPPPAATVAPTSPAPPPVPTRNATSSGAPAGDDAAYYYCTEKGKRVGPTSAMEITKLLDAETITNDTLVWREGFEDWVPIGHSSLRHRPTRPPPISGALINNTLVWIVAFVPIIGTVLINWIAAATSGVRNPTDPKAGEFVSDAWTFAIFIGLNLTLCLIDTSILKKAGYNTDRFGGWLWIVPIYLFKRAKALKQPLSYFVVWWICFFISLFL